MIYVKVMATMAYHYKVLASKLFHHDQTQYNTISPRECTNNILKPKHVFRFELLNCFFLGLIL